MREKISENVVKEARLLRENGYSFNEISIKIGINKRTIRKLVSDIKLPKNQIIEVIRRNKMLSAEEKYKKIDIDKLLFKDIFLSNKFYKALKISGLTEGAARYWCNVYDINISHKRPKFIYKKCILCDKEYKATEDKRMICNTCVSRLKRQENKIKTIKYLGGKCKKCGYEIKEDEFNFAAFEFHHPIDNKETTISEILNRKWDTIEKELNKCELLCSNCHRIEHSDYKGSKKIQEIKNKYLEQKNINKTIIINGNDIKIKKNDKIDKEYTAIKEDELRQMVKTESIKNISKKLNVPTYTIFKICKIKDIKIPKKHLFLQKFDVEKDELEKLVKEFPFTKIAKIYNVSDNSIRKRCKKLNINWKDISKYSHKNKNI